jgi:hypothetical protein
MNLKWKQLNQACWQSPIFGDAYASSLEHLEYKDFVLRMEERSQAFAARFSPILAKGLPDVSLEDREAFVRETRLRIIGLCSIIGVDFADTERLTAAAICYGLLHWGDALLDRGDTAMEAAIRLFLEENVALSPQLPVTVRTSSLSAVNSQAVQARLSALREIIPQITYLSRSEDAAVLLNTPCLNFFKHCLGDWQISQQYLQNGHEDFWKEYANAYVKHSILNFQVFGFTGLFYALYRQEDPKLPRLDSILNEPQLIYFLDRIANAAGRIFDDAGDQASDSGVTQGKYFKLNLFNARDPRLLRALFRFAGITDENLVARAIDAYQRDSYEGDAAIIQLFVDLLREHMKVLPQELIRRHIRFIILTKRLIESAYIDGIGIPG